MPSRVPIEAKTWHSWPRRRADRSEGPRKAARATERALSGAAQAHFAGYRAVASVHRNAGPEEPAGGGHSAVREFDGGHGAQQRLPRNSYSTAEPTATAHFPATSPQDNTITAEVSPGWVLALRPPPGLGRETRPPLGRLVGMLGAARQ